MPADASTYDADPQTGLALRILYSALVRCESLRFVTFWKELFPLGSMLDVDTVVSCCQLAFRELAPDRHGIVLLVDESAKLAHALDSDGAMRMLTALGSLLDSTAASELNVVCSTLDAMLLNTIQTSSGRRIAYVPLPELSQAAAEALFSRALATSLPTGQALPPAIRIAISDCAGHLRTLECLRIVAQASSPVATLDSLRAQTVERFIGDATPVWAVRAALRGDELALIDVVPGSSCVPFCDAITSGTFINTSAVGSSSVVPKLSMMLLLRFAHARGASSPLRSAILGMAAAEEVGCGLESPSLGGEPFEAFFSHLLRLLSVLDSNTDRLVQQLLHISPQELADSDLPEAVHELLLKPYSVNALHHRLALWPTVAFADAASDTRCHALQGAGIFSFVKNNPAFDVLYLTAPTTAKNTIAMAFEVRLTTPMRPVDGSGAGASAAASTRAVDHIDSMDEVDRKIALFRHEYCGSGGAFEGRCVKLDNVLYVYMAVRTITGYTAAVRSAYLARGVVVLDRAAAEVFLTPTLSGCLLFQERL